MEKIGVLARDLTVNQPKKFALYYHRRIARYETKGRYLSELGVKTMRDGSISLSEADFKKL